MENNKSGVWRFGIAVAYLAMVGVNALANFLPINGVTTGRVSDAYANLFAPAGAAFSIWGLIYLLLGAYVLYQFGFFQKDKEQNRQDRLALVGRYFVLTSVANIAWIFVWHYQIIWFSALLIAALLFFLIKIAGIVNQKGLGRNEKIFVRLPFSVYFGWITVATIANITVFLVSIGWDRFGFSESFWTVAMLFTGAVIGIWRTLKDKNSAYGLVLAWAYSWIWTKHVSETGFGGHYSEIINAAAVCVALFVLTVGYIFFKKPVSDTIK